jgi:hypothetical protein
MRQIGGRGHERVPCRPVLERILQPIARISQQLFVAGAEHRPASLCQAR